MADMAKGGNEGSHYPSTKSEEPHKASFLEYLLTHYRSLLCLFVLLPLSVLFETYLYIRNTLNFLTRWRAPKNHARRVKAIQTQVQAWEAKDKGLDDNQERPKMCSARPGWQTMSLRVGLYKSTSYKIQLGDLTEVLEINTAAQLVKVEPMVTMGQLTHALLPLGWTLPVLP